MTGRTRFSLTILAAAAAIALCLFAACGDGGDDDDDDNDDVPDGFEELCSGKDVNASFRAEEIRYDNGSAAAPLRSLKAGDIEVVHFIPEGPFFLKRVRLRFQGEAGEAIVHVYGDYGRSWPDEENDLIEPIRVDVEKDQGWVNLDVSGAGLFFHPSEHFWIGYEHTAEQPYLSKDHGAEIDGAVSEPEHSRLKSQDLIDGWRAEGQAFVWAGMTGSFLVRADGGYFCEWDEAEREMADVTDAAGLTGYTHMRTGWADLNGDGWDDIVLTKSGYSADSTAVLFNDQDGTFTDVTPSTGLSGHYQAINLMGDVDNDGDRDVYAGVYVPQDGTDEGARSKVFLNDGSGHFDEVADAGVDYEGTTSGAAFGDLDQDGALDLYVGNWLLEYPNPPAFTDWLFKGNGDGTFSDVTDAAGLTEAAQDGGRPVYGVVMGDYDNDSDLDIFVGNYGRARNFLWQNDGGMHFSDVAPDKGVDQHGRPSGGNTFGIDLGDFENDGDLDLYQTEIAHPRYQPASDIASLMRNLGADEDWSFEDVRETVGIAYDEGEIEVSWVDFDLDGDLDLSLSDLYPLHYARLYRQNDDLTFTDVTYMAGVHVHDATNHAWADFDQDGDEDLLISRRSDGGVVHLFENRMADGNHWLRVRLAGTSSNRDGVGARVYAKSGDLTQMREVKGGKGHFNSQPSLVQTIGLGDRDGVDTLTVVWPSGRTDEFTDVAADQTVTVTEGAAELGVE